jgi:hypothetical protein
MLGKIAKSMKDGALGIALKAYVNDRLGEYGEVLACNVDTGKSRIAARVLLKGDKEPITAAVEKYELSTEGEGEAQVLYATLRKFSSSRPWLTLLLTKLFTDKRYKLPNAVRNLL